MLEAARTFAAVLGRKLGGTVEAVIANDYEDLTTKLLDGRVHLAWMPPLAHARATRQGAVLAAVAERRGVLTYRSALMVRKESLFTSVQDLRGVRMAWIGTCAVDAIRFLTVNVLPNTISAYRCERRP